MSKPYIKPRNNINAETDNAIRDSGLPEVHALYDEMRRMRDDIFDALNALSDRSSREYVSNYSSIENVRGDVTILGDVKPKPVTWPMVPVQFVGGTIDFYTTTDNLTGPYQKQATLLTMSIVGNNLRLGGDENGTDMFVYTGRSGGVFIDKDSEFEVEITIDDIPEVGSNTAGLALADSTFADGLDFYNNTNIASIAFEFGANPGNSFIRYRLAGASTTTVTTQNYLPSVTGKPLCLKMKHTIVGTDHQIEFYYRSGTDAEWTLGATRTAAASHFTAALDCGPWMRDPDGNLTYVDFASWKYVDLEATVTPDLDAFIPVAHFRTYLQDYIYIRDEDETAFTEITPIEGMRVSTKTTQAQGEVYYYSTTYGWIPQATYAALIHAAQHQDGGADELPVDTLAESATPGNDTSNALRPDGSGGVAFSDVAHADLTGVTSDQHHAQTHTHASHTSIGADDHHPQLHAASHGPSQGDALRLDDLEVPEDNTDLNASISAHGLLPKLDNEATHYLDGQGGWTVPPSHTRKHDIGSLDDHSTVGTPGTVLTAVLQGDETMEPEVVAPANTRHSSRTWSDW